MSKISSGSLTVVDVKGGSDGINTATIYLYQRATTAPSKPLTNLTYTFATAKLTGGLGNWTQDIGTLTSSNPIWVIAAVASSNGKTDVIEPTEWSEPIKMAQDGQDGLPGTPGAPGTNGLNQATIFIYKRDDSVEKPNSVTYTFATGSFTVPTGWNTSIPQSNGKPCWVCSAVAIGSDDTAQLSWTNPSVMVEDGSDGVSPVVTSTDNGVQIYDPVNDVTYTITNGADGTSYYTHILYSSKATPTSASDVDTSPTGKDYVGIQTTTSRTAPSWNDSGWQWMKYVGNDGTSITVSSVKYAKSTTDSQPQDSSFNTTLPTVGEGEWLWTMTTYSDGSKVYTKSKQGKSGTSVTVSKTEYQAGTSATTAPTGEWKTTIPSVAEGQYLWTKTTYSDGNYSYTVAKQGKSGTSITISSTSVKYQVGTSATTAPTGEWKDTVQSTTTGQYLWTRTIVTYSDGSNTTSYSVSAHGATGNSISISSIKYATSTTDSQPADSSFGTSIPTVSEGQWLWTMTTYSNGSKMYTKSKQGKSGVSVTSTRELYWLKTNSTNPTQIAWNSSTSQPSVTIYSDNKINAWTSVVPAYVANGIYYTCIETTLNNSTKVWSTPVANQGLTDANANAAESLSVSTHANENAQGALSISRATQQHFWFVPENMGSGASLIEAGAYITDTAIDTFKSGKNGGYLLARSDGVELGRGTNKFMTLSATALNFYRPGTNTIDATLTSKGLVLSKGGIEAGTKNTTNYIYIYSDDDATNHKLTINSHEASDWRIVAGKNFGVDKAGNLYAANADITGAIKATSGFIGQNAANGFTISNTAIYNPTTKSTLGSDSVDGIYLGKDGIALGKGTFKVTSTGSLTAKSGTIGGWTIGTTFLSTSASGTPGANVITLSKGIAGPTTTTGVLPANKTWAFTASNKFGVTTAGDLYASSGTIAGNVTIGSSVTIGGKAQSEYLNSNIEVGGRNFIRNTGAFNGWTNCGSGTAGTFDTDNGIFTYPATTADGWTEIRPNANVPYSYVRDKEVTLSAEVKGTSGQVLSVMVDPYVSTTIAGDRAKFGNVYLKTNGGSTASSNTVTADGTWQKVYATVTINDAFFTGGSATVDFDSCYFGARASRLNTNHNAYSIRHIKIEKGNKATDWSPAPEDIDAQIEGIEVGGRNLIPATKTWKLHNGNWATDSTNYLGFSVIKITWDSGSKDGGVWNGLESNHNVEIKPDTDYVLSFWAKADANGRRLKHHFYPSLVKTCESSSGLTSIANDGNVDSILTTEWQRYWVRWHTLSSISGAHNLIVGRAYTTGTFYLAGAKLELGNKATDWTPAPEDAVDEEQYIYISKASGTTSVSGTTTWITETEDKQNTWSVKRPTYNSSYPVLFVAKQKKNVGGTVTCTTPIKDDTTTIIDGGHITTGTIDTNRLNADTIKSNIVQTTDLSADRIKSGTIDTNRLNADTIKSNIVQTTDLSADRIKSGTIDTNRLNADTIKSNIVQTTNLNASKITSGTLDANRIGANSITADKIAIGAIEEYENLLLDSDAPTTTKVKASYDRYWSDSGNNKIVCSNFSLTDAPEQGLKYGRRFVYNGSVATNNYCRAYAFYNTGNNAIPFVPNQTYTATWWARCTSGSGRTRIVNSSGKSSGNDGTSTSTTYTLTSYWKKYSYSFTYGSTLNTNDNRIWFYATFPTSTAGTVEICGCKLVVGGDAESYITRIDNNGIRVHPSSTENNSVVINADGMEVYQEGTSVAHYGDYARVGKDGEANTTISPNQVTISASDDISALKITPDGNTQTIIKLTNIHKTIHYKDSYTQTHPATPSSGTKLIYRVTDTITGKSRTFNITKGTSKAETTVEVSTNFKFKYSATTTKTTITNLGSHKIMLEYISYTYTTTSPLTEVGGVLALGQYPSIGTQDVLTVGYGSSSSTASCFSVTNYGYVSCRELRIQENNMPIYLTTTDGWGADALSADASNNLILGRGWWAQNTSGYNTYIEGYETNLWGRNKIATNIAITQGSDKRLKKDIKNLEDVKDFVMDLKPVEFKYEFVNDKAKHLGFIAQDVEKSMDAYGLSSDKYGLMTEITGTDNIQYKGLNYTEFIPMCIKMIQEQQQEIDALKEALNEVLGN